ncbi:hypothetical protein KC318_g4062 [Hortaea werneckii]|nr:hypothetical protein KC334_g3714 [Hortaea werneckii]KAI7014423.1 hypothetical protein KC355_g4701 [Hortaea werneckii]KAI7188314.1 hypothetical protein KC324_g6647 [Hortaea werneckii]KAI7585203.1 hypothetical protein KC316_g6296 [Hortaea werneckii]KAI7670412.1 hypothetical protein KC318_g4062 [Hortaea werneckii]
MSLKTTVEIVVNGNPIKCTVEVPLAALSLDVEPSHVTALKIADFAATTTAEVAKAVRRQDSDLGVETPDTGAIDANIKDYDSWETNTLDDDPSQKEGHLNFSQGSSTAPSPGDDGNEAWFRNVLTEKFVEKQTALGLRTTSSTMQPLQDGTYEWSPRPSCDPDQPTSNDSPCRQNYCKNCDTGYCWDHPPRCVDSQEALGDTNCGKSSVLLHDNVAQPSPSDWGRDDRISQSGGDWANGLGFTPSSDTQVGSNVQPASDIEGATDAQIIKVYVTNGIFKERCYNIKSTCALTGLFEDVSSDFEMDLDGLIHLRMGFAIRPNGTAEECHDNGELAMSADIPLKSIGATFSGNQDAEVAQRLHAVTYSLAGGLMKALQDQVKAVETAKGPKEIKDAASEENSRKASTAAPPILNCAASGGFTLVFTFAFQTHNTMCEISFDTSIFEAMEAFATHAGEPLENLRFYYCDRKILHRCTPVDLDMAEGDVINVIRFLKAR